jgi:hypothetical protein
VRARSFKAQFDPRSFAKALAARAEDAVEGAKRISEELASGALNPSDPEFSQVGGWAGGAPRLPRSGRARTRAAPSRSLTTAPRCATWVAHGSVVPSYGRFVRTQGMYDLAPKIDPDKPPSREEAPKFAPALCFSPARVALDMRLSRRLLRALDAEKVGWWGGAYAKWQRVLGLLRSPARAMGAATGLGET